VHYRYTLLVLPLLLQRRYRRLKQIGLLYKKTLRCLLKLDLQLHRKISAGKRFQMTDVAYENECLAKDRIHHVS